MATALVAVTGAFAVPTGVNASRDLGPPPKRQVAGELIVRFAAAASHDRRAAARRRIGIRDRRTLRVRNAELLTLRPGRSVSEARAEAERAPGVLYAEPNYVYRAMTVPNDTRFGEQWGLANSGQPVAGEPGTALADIGASAGWSLTTGSPDVTIAVVDTGVRADHPDLTGAVVPGRDWVAQDWDAADENGHGTHVAGIVAARGNDASGVAGVDWNVSVLPLRVLDRNGSGTADDVADAFAYAGARGVEVVNASLAGSGRSNVIADAMRQSPETLFVVAAGNSGANTDAGSETYPCNSTNANLICVAATDQHDRLTSFSNHGPVSVDVAAPGTNVLSTYPRLREQFRDDFESDPAARWTLSSDWRRDSGWSTSGTYSLASSCAAYECGNALLKTSLDGYSAPGCRLDWNMRLEAAPRDYLDVEYRTDLIGWSSLGAFGGGTRGHVSVSAPSVSGSEFYVRLRLNSPNAPADDPDTLVLDDMRFSCLDLDAPADGYEYLDGTSMAAPFVAGVAALVYARSPALSPTEVKARVLAGADQLPDLQGKTVSGGRVNAYGALTASVPNDRVEPAGTISTLRQVSPYTYIASVRSLPDGGYLMTLSSEHRVERVGADGTATTIAGTGVEGFSGDGGAATSARLTRPRDAVPLADGGVLIADTGNGRIRKVHPNGLITTVAGTGPWDYNGDDRPATTAELDAPTRVSPMADGGFLIAESQGRRIRRVDPEGNLSTVAGNGSSPSGIPLGIPTAVLGLSDGGFMFADGGAAVVRRVSPAGAVTTIAGTGSIGFAGDGGPATRAWLRNPGDIAVLGDGGVLIADAGNYRVRRVSPDGRITTVAGTASYGFSGDGGPATSAELNPGGLVAPIGDGAFLVGDPYNHRVRVVTAPEGSPPPPAAPNASSTRASSVATSSASLNGTVYANDQPTTYWFEYGRTTAYGSSTAEAATGADALPHAVSANVAGLEPGTTYHFRIVARNASGTSVGADQAFATTPATAPAAPGATTGPARSVGANSAQLSATIDPNGSVTSYRFVWGATTAYGHETELQALASSTEPQDVGITLTGLAPETTYHFRVVATNAGGTDYGADRTFTTAPDEPDSPDLPSPDQPGEEEDASSPGFLDPTGPAAGSGDEAPNVFAPPGSPAELELSADVPSRATARHVRRRGLGFEVACSARCRLVATLRLKRRGKAHGRHARSVVIGRLRRMLPAGRPVKRRLKLNRRGRRLVTRSRRTRAVLRLAVTDGAVRRVSRHRVVIERGFRIQAPDGGTFLRE